MKPAILTRAIKHAYLALWPLVPLLVVAWFLPEWGLAENAPRMSLPQFMLVTVGGIGVVVGLAIGLDWLLVKKHTWVVHDDHVEVLHGHVSRYRIPFSEIRQLKRLSLGGVVLTTIRGNRHVWNYLSEEQMKVADALCAQHPDKAA